MKIEMGESLFYSWLRHVKHCQIVQTNWKASPKWEVENEGKLNKLMDESVKLFYDRFGGSIYKKNTSLDQILRQGECDGIGICLSEDVPVIHALDVAFHTSGLNYNGRENTIMKVLEKEFRTAMCIYGYFNIEDAEIVFASPKITPAVYKDLKECIGEANELMRRLGYKYIVKLIANEDFNEKVLKNVIHYSNEIADTSELFLRSYQLYAMFNDNDNVLSKNNYDETRVGSLANTELRNILKSGVLSPKEIEEFTKDNKKSREVFGLDYPLLVPAGVEIANHRRYYIEPIQVKGKSYRLTSQWYEKNREKLTEWIIKHKK